MGKKRKIIDGGRSKTQEEAYGLRDGGKRAGMPWHTCVMFRQ
jgi:hypothetical protein